MKVACLLASHLPVQVERIHDPSLAKGPLVVGGRPWDPGAVLDCCPQAASFGIHPGMRLSQAETLCATAHFVPARENSYHAAHDALTAAAGHFSPSVETASLGLLYANVSGLERRLGPDTQLAHTIAREAAQACRLDVRVGIGSGKFVAQQAAHAAQFGRGCAVPPNEERAFLSPLPLSALPIDGSTEPSSRAQAEGLAKVPEMQRRLHLLGVRSLGALAALPRLAIVRQFGPHAGPLHDLARGIDPRPVHPNAPPLTLDRTRTFNDPLNDRAPLLAHVDQMVAELTEILSRQGYQAEGLRLYLEEESGAELTAAMPIKSPFADAEKVFRVASRLLGEISPAGPVSALSLTLYPLRPFHLGATQLTLFNGASNTKQERLREALRRLRDRFGEMIIVVASLIAPPRPRPIHVTTDPAGRPRALVWRDRIRQIDIVYERWRERRYWWSRPVERDYFRLGTDDGQMRVIFHDTRADGWMLERRHV